MLEMPALIEKLARQWTVVQPSVAAFISSRRRKGVKHGY
jgi:hypothetical protein